MKSSGTIADGLLGRGIYRLADVARYAQISPSRAYQWFTTSQDLKRRSVFESDYSDLEGGRFVSFLDLVDAAVVGQLREAGVSMKKIRKVYSYVQKQWGISHPFAHFKIYTDGKEIITEAAEGDPSLTELLTGQGLFKQVKKVLMKVEHSQLTGLAHRWRIAEGVVIDPSIGFGQPVVEGTGISTLVIARAYKANKNNAALVAGLFDIAPRRVEQAAHFEASYTRRTAA